MPISKSDAERMSIYELGTNLAEVIKGMALGPQCAKTASDSISILEAELRRRDESVEQQKALFYGLSNAFAYGSHPEDCANRAAVFMQTCTTQEGLQAAVDVYRARNQFNDAIEAIKAGIPRQVEILGPSGVVHYRRPEGDPLINEAHGRPGYSCRYEDTGEVIPKPEVAARG